MDEIPRRTTAAYTEPTYLLLPFRPTSRPLLSPPLLSSPWHHLRPPPRRHPTRLRPFLPPQSRSCIARSRSSEQQQEDFRPKSSRYCHLNRTLNPHLTSTRCINCQLSLPSPKRSTPSDMRLNRLVPFPRSTPPPMTRQRRLAPLPSLRLLSRRTEPLTPSSATTSSPSPTLLYRTLLPTRGTTSRSSLCLDRPLTWRGLASSSSAVGTDG